MASERECPHLTAERFYPEEELREEKDYPIKVSKSDRAAIFNAAPLLFGLAQGPLFLVVFFVTNVLIALTAINLRVCYEEIYQYKGKSGFFKGIS